MSNRDDDLDQLLSPLAEPQPSLAQIQKWQQIKAPGADTFKRRNLWLSRAIQLAAACVLGFIIGFYFKDHKDQSENLAVNFASAATIEVVYTKSE